MDIKEAIEYLKYYNAWRTDSSLHIPEKDEQPEPKKITEAINVVIRYYQDTIFENDYLNYEKLYAYKKAEFERLLLKCEMLAGKGAKK